MDKNAHSNKIGNGPTGLPMHIEDLWREVKDQIDAEVPADPGNEDKRMDRVKTRLQQYMIEGGMEKGAVTEKLHPEIVQRVRDMREKCIAIWRHASGAA